MLQARPSQASQTARRESRGEVVVVWWTVLFGGIHVTATRMLELFCEGASY